jgi:hypothetical protein
VQPPLGKPIFNIGKESGISSGTMADRYSSKQRGHLARWDVSYDEKDVVAPRGVFALNETKTWRAVM